MGDGAKLIIGQNTKKYSWSEDMEGVKIAVKMKMGVGGLCWVCVSYNTHEVVREGVKIAVQMMHVGLRTPKQGSSQAPERVTGSMTCLIE